MISATSGGAHLPDAALVKWNKSNDELFCRKLQHFMGSVSYINNGLLPINPIEFFTDSFILADLLELHQINRADVKRSLILRAITEVARNSSKTLPAFQHALADIIRTEANKPLTKFHVILPLNIERRISISPPSITALGVRFFLRSWPQVERQYDVAKWHSQWGEMHSSFVERSSVPLIAILTEREATSAFEKAVTAFDLLRCALNMDSTWHTTTITFGGSPKSLARILAPPVYGVFDSDKQHLLTYAANRPLQEWPFNAIKKETFDRARTTLKNLKVPESEETVRQLLIDGFRLYGQAMESIEWQDAFMDLWRIVELVTIPVKAQFSTQIILKRANTLLHRDQSLIDTLKIAHDARNELVHRGKFSEEGYILVQMLKNVVEVCLSTLVYLEPKYPGWKDLTLYYDQMSVLPNNVEDQKKYLRSLNYLQKLQNLK